jgi:hypothetical protein
MKSITTVFILLITFFCNSQNNQEMDITGNWFNYSTRNTENLYYLEIFIGDKAFHFYDEFSGFKKSQEYIIIDNILYFVNHDNTKENIVSVKLINENTISILKGDLIYKRINEGLKLEDLLRNNKSETNYRKFFNERKAVWEESRNN